MTRYHYACFGGVLGLALLLGLGLETAHRNKLAPLEAKAKKFDEVCLYVKSSIKTDRLIIQREPMNRKQVVANFAGLRVGDGYQMLDWCVPHAKEFVAEFQRCQGNDDLECMERVLSGMEMTVNAP